MADEMDTADFFKKNQENQNIVAFNESSVDKGDDEGRSKNCFDLIQNLEDQLDEVDWLRLNDQNTSFDAHAWHDRQTGC